MGPPSDDELETMRRVMAEAMEDGAFGVSYALIYPPDVYTTTDELVEVCKVVAEYNGVYITHIRTKASCWKKPWTRPSRSGALGAPVEIYHLKASGAENWHKIPGVIEQINRARAEGIDITADMYPYAASGTGLTAVMPPWSMADGKLYDNLDDPADVRQDPAEMLNPSGDGRPWPAAIHRRSCPSALNSRKTRSTSANG